MLSRIEKGENEGDNNDFADKTRIKEQTGRTDMLCKLQKGVSEAKFDIHKAGVAPQCEGDCETDSNCTEVPEKKQQNEQIHSAVHY